MKIEHIKLIYPHLSIELCLKGFLTSLSVNSGFVFNENWIDFYGTEKSLYISVAYKAIKITI